ncbi:MAG: glycosyltransferase, partial [Bradyrhizobium sp.]
YTPTGCLDGVTQSTFGAWSPTACARCVWHDRPEVCSDAKNQAWAKKRELLVDLISLDCGPAIDFNASPKAFRGPLTAALDPAFWHPDLEPPAHLRRPRTRDDEVIVYHGVGNHATRTRDGVNVKGTHAVVAAIDALRAEGIPIRLDFVHDVPSIDNRFVQVQADIIVDQLNHGRYGATAREGMMLGKPVVARINPWDGDGVPATQCILETPVVNADERTIKDVLRDLALDPAKRTAIGRASREHALKWCAASELAKRFERVYESVRETGRPPRGFE